MDIKVGDLVGRKSYGCDVVFRVHDILQQNGKTVIILKGMSLRILADAPEADVVKLPPSKINENVKNYTLRAQKLMKRLEKRAKKPGVNIGSSLGREEPKVFQRPGKVLHIDGDKNYLDMCMKSYRDLNIDAVGKVVPEADQPKMVESLLLQYNPDILVLTGHDAYAKAQQQSTTAEQAKRDLSNLNNYKNSKFYMESVKIARKYEPSLDDLVIFAGACQSYFEGIMEAGANFASSPERVLIHALDPVMVCEKVALTPIDKLVPLKEVLTGTITGLNGIGGVQTRGKYRDGMPKSRYGNV